MSTMVTVRLDERLLAEVDRERRRAAVSRAQAFKEALALWVEARRLAEAVERHRTAYEEHPVESDEFEGLIGAQRWPR